MSSAAAGLLFPGLGSLPNHRQSVSLNPEYSLSGPLAQAVTGDESSSSSSPLRVVSHILQQKSSSQAHRSLARAGRSRLLASGGVISSREDDVSTSGRTWPSPTIGIGSGSRRWSASSGNGNRLQSKGKSKSNAGPDVLPSLSPNEAEKSASSFVARDEGLESPSPYPEGNGDVNLGLEVTEAAAGTQESNDHENSVRTMEERLDALAVQESSTATEEAAVVVSLKEDPSIPTMEDIIATAAQEGVKLQVMSFGPTFQIVVSNLDETQMFGKADGWTKWWGSKGKILHLESVKLERGLSKQVGNLGGAGFFVGAATLRYGLDQGCRIAELLAIYDDEVTHDKLVKYYSRFGFKKLYEVNEEELKYLPDRVVWGGVGTRMDADCEELLRRWSVVLKPKARSRTKGFSSRT